MPRCSAPVAAIGEATGALLMTSIGTNSSGEAAGTGVRICRRHVNNRFALTSCRRATNDTDAPGS